MANGISKLRNKWIVFVVISIQSATLTLLFVWLFSLFLGNITNWEWAVYTVILLLGSELVFISEGVSLLVTGFVPAITNLRRKHLVFNVTCSLWLAIFLVSLFLSIAVFYTDSLAGDLYYNFFPEQHALVSNEQEENQLLLKTANEITVLSLSFAAWGFMGLLVTLGVTKKENNSETVSD